MSEGLKGIKEIDLTTADRVIDCRTEASPELILNLLERLTNFNRPEIQEVFVQSECTGYEDFKQKFLNRLTDAMDTNKGGDRMFYENFPVIHSTDPNSLGNTAKIRIAHFTDKPNEYFVQIGPAHGISSPVTVTAVRELRQELISMAGIIKLAKV